MSQLTFKVMLLGDIGVGKTSIARQLVFRTFETQYKATLGVEIYAHSVRVNVPSVATDVALSIWDVDGDIGPGIFKHIYVAGADAALVLADVTRDGTRRSALAIAQMFAEQFPGRPAALVLNKADLSAQAAAEQLDAVRRLRHEAVATSAKTGANVDDCFASLAGHCVVTAGGAYDA